MILGHSFYFKKHKIINVNNDPQRCDCTKSIVLVKKSRFFEQSLALIPSARFFSSNAKSGYGAYSLASWMLRGSAPIGMPCLCSVSRTVSFNSLLYESKSNTLLTTFTKPSLGNFCKHKQWLLKQTHRLIMYILNTNVNWLLFEKGSYRNIIKAN
jgi:hypothetical protein